MGFFVDEDPVQAPVNPFMAQQARLPTHNYGEALRQAQAAQANVGAQQSQLGGLLMQRAQGQGPSVAELQLQQATQQNAQQAAGLLGSRLGLNPALVARQAAMMQAGANQTAAGQAALLRAQEQQGAQALLAQALAAQRGQDLGMFGSAGGLQNQQSGLTIENLMRQQALNQLTMGQNQQAQLETNRMNMQQAQADSDRRAALAGQVINAGGGAIAKAAGAAHGGRVLGQAQVPGDHPANDSVPAWLSPGEIVIPRSIAGDPDAAAAFVEALNRRRSGPRGYGAVLDARRRAGG